MLHLIEVGVLPEDDLEAKQFLELRDELSGQLARQLKLLLQLLQLEVVAVV